MTDPQEVAEIILLQERLQRSEAELPTAALKPELAFLRGVIASKFPCIGDPAALSGADMAFYSRAVALLGAARLYYPVTSGAAGGNLVSMATADGSKEQYAAPPSDLPQLWAKEATESLSRISCVVLGFRSAATGITLFGLSGRTRSLEAQGIYPSLMGFGLGLLDTGAYPLAGYVGSDFFRNQDYFSFGSTI